MAPELREEWIPRIAKGEMMSLAFTEPGGGADAGNIRTKAVRDGDDYVINGEKTSITFCGVSKVVFVSARTGGPGPRGLSFFLVPTDTPGVTATNFERMGQRLDRGGSFFFDDVRIPAREHDRRGEQGLHLGDDDHRLQPLLRAAGLHRCRAEVARRDDRVRQAPDRVWAGRCRSGRRLRPNSRPKPPSSRPRGMLCYRGLWMKDQGLRHDDESSMAKWWGVKAANEVLYTCMRLNGHYGWAKDLPHEQRLRDCLGMESADGPREVHMGIIARGLLGKEFAPF